MTFIPVHKFSVAITMQILDCGIVYNLFGNSILINELIGTQCLFAHWYPWLHNE